MGAATDQREAAEAIAADQPEIVRPRLAAALVAALKDLSVVEAARTATVPIKAGGSYSYNYADIADVVRLTRPALAAQGVVALTPVHAFGSGLACTVTLLHDSGEQMDLGPFPFEAGRDAQSTGSAVTYHRRYALIAALGLAAGDDDDGAAAKASKKQSAAAGPSADAVNAAAALDSLPDPVAAEIQGRMEDKAGVRMLDALEEEGWRKWLTGAIDHATKKLKEEA